MHTCPDCGGSLLGDGFTEVIHCERVSISNLNVEPDSDPVFCQNQEDEDIEIIEEPGDREPFFPKPSAPEDRELSQRTAMREALTGMRMALMLLIHSSENAEWIKSFDAAHYSGAVLDNLDYLITTLNNKETA